MKLIYFFVRLWPTSADCANPEDPRYVKRIEDEAEVQWTVTLDFVEAHYFKSEKAATRVTRGVQRIADRIARGWLFEIIRVEEEVVATNVPVEEKEPTA